MNIFIYVLVIIIIYYFNIIQKLNTYYNIDYLSTLTQSDKLLISSFYHIIQRYSFLENLLVESSIKIGHGNFNPHRYTVPIHFKNFKDNQLLNFCHEICPIKNKNINTTIYDYLKCSLDKIIDGDSDIIIGYDYKRNIYKIYINVSNEDMECLEIDYVNYEVNRKIYNVLLKDKYHVVINNLNNYSQSLLSSLNLDIDNYKLVYRKNHNIYHIILRCPFELDIKQINIIEKYFNIDLSKWIRIIKYRKYLIYVISIEKNDKIIENICLYMRPNNLLSKVTYMMKYIGIFF